MHGIVSPFVWLCGFGFITAKSMRNNPRPSRNCERFTAILATDGTVFELFCYTIIIAALGYEKKNQIVCRKMIKPLDFPDISHYTPLSYSTRE